MLLFLFLLCDQGDQGDQVVPAHQVDDIDEVHELDPVHQVDPVSYTHLTLPTILRV